MAKRALKLVPYAYIPDPQNACEERYNEIVECTKLKEFFADMRPVMELRNRYVHYLATLGEKYDMIAECYRIYRENETDAELLYEVAGPKLRPLLEAWRRPVSEETKQTIRLAQDWMRKNGFAELV